jgi:hypothetical protein
METFDKELSDVVNEALDELGLVPSEENIALIRFAVCKGIKFGLSKAQKCLDPFFDALGSAKITIH